MEQARLRDTSWSDVKGIDQYLSKAIAHDYHLFVFGFALVLSGPMLMKRFSRV